MLVVVGPLPGEWEDGDVARQVPSQSRAIPFPPPSSLHRFFSSPPSPILSPVPLSSYSRFSSSLLMPSSLSPPSLRPQLAQRAAALEALATADGLVVSPAYLLVAQYNIGFASSRSTQEVMLVLDDNPWFDDSSSDTAQPS